MARTLHGALQENAARFPERPWLRQGDVRWSYAEGNAQADRIAAGLLRTGVAAGDRVGLLFANCPELALCYFACFKIGAVAVPINTRFQTAEVVYALGHAQAVVLIGQTDLCVDIIPLRDQLPRLTHVYVDGEPLAGTSAFASLCGEPLALGMEPASDGDAVVALLYTSGTTAKPKGVIHTHRTLLRQNANLIETYGADTFAVTVVGLPMCHIVGFSLQTLIGTEVGGALWILPRFDPELALQTLAHSRASYVFVLPTHVNMIVNCPGAETHDLSALSLCLCGGDCLPSELHSRFKALFGVDIDEGCGMTEIIYTLQPRLGGERRVGSIGKPIGDVRIRLEDPDGGEVAAGDVGEIVIFSDAVTRGYWNDPQSTASAIRDGGMRSGDLARRDDDGFYWFIGRSKDIIIRGGSNISPGEVEDVLYAHPTVYEAGVVGVPDPELGERVRAHVSLKSGCEATERDLIAWCGERLAAYKVPESIVFADQLPKGPTGKVLRRALRALSA
jgi:long-chain acyl-CoA synthetase